MIEKKEEKKRKEKGEIIHSHIDYHSLFMYTCFFIKKNKDKNEINARFCKE